MTLPSSDFYALLRIPRDAPSNDIKHAYHRTLLRLHPDKQRTRSCLYSVTYADRGVQAILDPCDAETSSVDVPVDMALLKEAYRTLSDATLRAAYDRALRREEEQDRAGPRPAQVVSLEDFSVIAAESDSGVQAWQYACRCGGLYHITEGDLESGTHLVGCESCSEAIWIGYEEAATEDEHGSYMLPDNT